jgi:hypothetical protein
VSKNVRQRLLDGDHRGCANWKAVAAKFGKDERHIRVVRKILKDDGHEIALDNTLARGVASEATAESDPHQAMGSVQPDCDNCGRRQSKSNGCPEKCHVQDARWPNVAAFDSETGIDVVPVGHTIKSVSTTLGPDGEIKQQRVTTTSTKQDNCAVLLEAIKNIAAHWPSIPDAIEPPKYSDDDLLCVYPMGDPHIGMLSWAPETGENFDLAIAERNLVAAVDHLALLAPPAKRAIIATVGDTFHSDGLANTTTAGTRVDVDGRTSKMIDVGVRTFRRLIHRALMRHEEVEVKIAPGNHDALLSVVLRVALSQFFENEPRVIVDQSPEDFLWYRFGLNLLGINHGHRAKADSLMQAMAVDRAKDWGETRHRRMYTGHVHHETTKEVPGCTVDTLNTLASSDDWHRRQGYRATRHMRMDIIHRNFGLINRHIVGIEQLRAA